MHIFLFSITCKVALQIFTCRNLHVSVKNFWAWNPLCVNIIYYWKLGSSWVQISASYCIVRMPRRLILSDHDLYFSLFRSVCVSVPHTPPLTHKKPGQTQMIHLTEYITRSIQYPTSHLWKIWHRRGLKYII